MWKIFPTVGVKATHWIRKTDNAACQFKCQYVLNNLLKIRKKVSSSLESVRFDYFEANEGKNLSDTLGSIAKQAIERESLRASDGVGDNSPDQRMVIAHELKRRLLAGLHFDDGQVGTFSFFK